MSAEKFDYQNPRPLPETMPLKELDGLDVVFSDARGHLHNGGAYLSYHDGQCEHIGREWKDKANSLFFKGGALADFGLRIKPGLDQAQVMKNLKWLLSSWGPKHEEKEATVGFALQSWCEPVAAAKTASGQLASSRERRTVTRDNISSALARKDAKPC